MVQEELGLCYHSSDILPPPIVGWTVHLLFLFPGNIHPTTAQHLPLYVPGALHNYPKKNVIILYKKNAVIVIGNKVPPKYHELSISLADWQQRCLHPLCRPEHPSGETRQTSNIR